MRRGLHEHRREIMRWILTYALVKKKKKKTGDRKIDRKDNRTDIFPMLVRNCREYDRVYVNANNDTRRNAPFFSFFFLQTFVSISLTIQRNKLKFNLLSMSGQGNGSGYRSCCDGWKFAMRSVLKKQKKRKKEKTWKNRIDGDTR